MKRLRILLAVAPLLLLALAAPSGAVNRGVPLNLGDSVATRISPPSDVDTFVFEAFAGTKVSFSLAPAKGSELAPGLEVVDPAGGVIDPGDRLKAKGSKISVKGLILDETGLHAVRVLDVSGSLGVGGDYILKTRGKPARGVKDSALLAAGGTQDFLFGATTDTRATVKIKAKGGEGFEIASVFDPTGGEVPGGKAAFVFTKKGARATIFATGALGDYGVRIANGAAEAAYSVKVRCRHEKVKKQKLEVGIVEPTVGQVDPDRAVPGATVTVRGSNFKEGEPLVLFGETPSPTAVRNTLEEISAVVPSGTGTVAVTVVNPDGQEGTLPAAFTFGAAYSISGTVSGDATAGVMMELTGDHASTGITAAGGLYAFAGLADGSYTVTPSLPAHEFDPVSRDVVVSGADVTGVDFTSVRTGPLTNPAPPSSPLRLVFVHHSCGKNWLDIGNGDLGTELGENSYCVRDTYYGWDAPENTDIGDLTDIGHWYTWFADTTVQGNATARRDNITEALYTTDSTVANYIPIDDPGGENDIVMFKSCYPNSAVKDDNATVPADLFGQAVGVNAHTLSNTKQVYREILEYFETRTDKMFVVVTAPPLASSSLGDAANARALNEWLVSDWLEEADWEHKNVFVFDLFNVLTDEKNHHRVYLGQVQHESSYGSDLAYYVTGGDSHPTGEGNQKATAEFVPLLNVFYHRWREYLGNE